MVVGRVGLSAEAAEARTLSDCHIWPGCTRNARLSEHIERSTMSTDEKTRDETGAGAEAAQAKLTTSVGTALLKPEKTGKRKLFGRRERPSTGS